MSGSLRNLSSHNATGSDRNLRLQLSTVWKRPPSAQPPINGYQYFPVDRWPTPNTVVIFTRQRDEDSIFDYSKLLRGCTVSTGKCLLTLQRSGSSSKGYLILSMKAPRSFETSVTIYQTTRNSIAEDLYLHTQATRTSNLATFSFTLDVVCTVHHPTICIWTNKMHKILVGSYTYFIHTSSTFIIRCYAQEHNFVMKK